MMTLLDIIERIDQLNDEDVVFVRPEWSPESEAALFELTGDLEVPAEPKQLGLKYFLEVAVAREVLDGFASRPDATTREKAERLIHYATYDA